MADEAMEERENEIVSNMTSRGSNPANTMALVNRAVVISSMKTKTISQVCQQNTTNKQAAALQQMQLASKVNNKKF